MLSLYLPAFVVALVITVTEMTEVVAVVFALSAEHGSIHHGAGGAVAGTAVVAFVALAFGAAILAVPHNFLLWGSALVLLAFGLFLYRSTLRSYRRAAAARAAPATPPSGARILQFAGGFSVGAVETIEAVIVLLALTAAGYGSSAIIGALIGGGLLVAFAVVVHERIRRIKVPQLKLGATSLLFTFAVFWGVEAAKATWTSSPQLAAWPSSDLILVPLFVVALLLVRGSLAAFMSPGTQPVQRNG